MKHVMALAVALASAACATTPFAAPQPGVAHYVYTEKEVTPGQPDSGYRVAFDFDTKAGPAITAIVTSAEVRSGASYKPATIDPACRTALKAGPGEIARIKVYPLSKEESAMGAAFMATCAPEALFFPLTDIVNVALIVASPQFGADKLKAVGDSRRFGAFSTTIDRPDNAFTASSPGGTTSLTALTPARATLDWEADPMAIVVIHRTPGTPEVKLSGTERFGFRVDVDRRTGALLRAATPSDALDVTVSMPGLPPGVTPRMTVTRDVLIERR